MKKLNLLLLTVTEKLNETLKHQKDARNQGNPHLTTKYQAQASMLLFVIEKINELLSARSIKK